MVIFGCLQPPARATNFGSFCAAGPPATCVAMANNKYHAVRYQSLGTQSGDIPNIRAAVDYILANEFDPTDLVAYHDDVDTLPDVIVSDAMYAQYNGVAGWTNCPGTNTGTGGTHPNWWCRGQTIVFNTYMYWYWSDFFDTDNQRRFMACHEMGHSVGLRHRTDTKSTCMWYQAGDSAEPWLGSHDISHINAKY